MDKLKALGPHEMDEAHNFVTWSVKHEVGSLTGTQSGPGDSYHGVSLDSFSRHLGQLLDQRAPPVVHWRAVRDGTALLEAWRQTPDDHVLIGNVHLTTQNLTLTAGVREVLEVLAQTHTKRLDLALDDPYFLSGNGDGHELYSPQQLAIATMNAGLVLSTVICGEPLVGGNTQALQQGSLIELGVGCYSTSDTILASVCSALAVSPSKAWLNVSFSETLSPARWSKLAVRGTRIFASITLPLGHEYVSVTAEVLKNFYPEPAIPSTTLPDAEYGFIDIEEGAKLQPRGLLNDDNSALMLSHSCRCRAFYNPDTMKDSLDVIVPGYGVCEMSLDADSRATQFVQDKLDMAKYMHRGQAWYNYRLDLDICSIVRESLLKELFMLIGGRLRYLSLKYTGNGRVSLRLDDLAAACPELEELTIDWFAVSLTGDAELRNWGIGDLTIETFEEIRGLPNCLQDSSYRMSRELWRLRLTLNSARPEYLESPSNSPPNVSACHQDEIPDPVQSRNAECHVHSR